MPIPLTSLVGYLLLFVAIAIFFLFSTLLIGKLVRPKLPNPEKEAIYECGEPTIGSSWIQFDLRFYVVALLFVIFDVEVAFFFPWAVVFGKATRVADRSVEAVVISEPNGLPVLAATVEEPLDGLGFRAPESSDPNELGQQAKETQEAAGTLARIAFGDLLIFFGVVLVGFAYIWKRGDLDWVRATEVADAVTPSGQTQPAEPAEAEAAAATSSGSPGHTAASSQVD